MSTDPVIALTQDLIRRASLTPDDAGCLDLISERLTTAGFIWQNAWMRAVVIQVQSGDELVKNLWATYTTNPEGPVLAGWSCRCGAGR